MDALDDVQNLGSDDIRNHDTDESESISSDSSFEPCSETESEDENPQVAWAGSTDQSMMSEIEPMSESQVELINMESLSNSGYVFTSNQPEEDNDSASSSSSSAPVEVIDLTADDDDREEVLEEIGTILEAVGPATEISSDQDFPNLNGAGDHVNQSKPVVQKAVLEPAPQTSTVARIQETESDFEDIDDYDDDDDDDFEDETIAERLWGLTEMFPDSLRSTSKSAFDISKTSTKVLYTWGRKALWVAVTSVIVLYLPVALEVERIQMEKESLGEAQDILLGDATSQGKTKSSEPPMPTVS